MHSFNNIVPNFAAIPELITELQQGNFIILVDDENRENEGDLVFAAQFSSAKKINFMIKKGGGLICLIIDQQKQKQLKLPFMTNNNTSKFGTNMTVSIGAAYGISTGISATDRAHTILTATQKTAKTNDLVCPGHIFPIVAAENGVLQRRGHTEATYDLIKLANLASVGVLCEILDENGEAAKGNKLHAFAQHHKIKIGKIDDIVNYRQQNEK